MSSEVSPRTERDLDLTALAASLGDQLRGRPPEKAVEVLQLFIHQGLSARAAAREAGVTEQIVMLWINALGLKRSRTEIQQMQKQALQIGRARHIDRMADQKAVRHLLAGVARR